MKRCLMELLVKTIQQKSTCNLYEVLFDQQPYTTAYVMNDFPDNSTPFHIYMDVPGIQLDAVMAQHKKLYPTTKK